MPLLLADCYGSCNKIVDVAHAPPAVLQQLRTYSILFCKRNWCILHSPRGNRLH